METSVSKEELIKEISKATNTLVNNVLDGLFAAADQVSITIDTAKYIRLDHLQEIVEVVKKGLFESING